MKTKKIRFIDSSYNTLFEVNEGEKIKITFPDGEVQIRQIFFIDEYHIKTKTEGYRDGVYHICEFAEKMEKSNAIYEPL